MTLPPNFGRAIDLSALGKPPVTQSVSVAAKEVTAANLASEFLPLSREKVVILLCWSARSPESIAVLEILAKLQNQDADKWILGTVNIDVEAQVAQALQVRTIPYAIAIVAEQVVPLFEQSHPEAQIRSVIDKVLAIGAEQGIGGVPQEIIEPEEEEAVAALESGNYAKAEEAYKKLLSRKPADPYAKIGLAQTQLLIRTSNLDSALVAKAADAQPENIDLQIQCADCEMVAGDVDTAFSRLLQAVRISSGDEKNQAKNHLLELFSLVDSSDPRLVKARNALASALF
ncbi:MAG TPA: tetratricopeptide repeat protein [Candidatus Paceibacterota bacterium]|nr:tetratricopeptide repeat protein [Candidatus Paceibacterota bacterium]